MLHDELDLNRQSSILAERFGDLAVVLLLIAAITMIGSLVPFRFDDSTWLIDAIGTLIAIGPLALAALILLHLGSIFSPDSPWLTSRRILCCRLAIFVVVGYLLLIPLQVSTGFQQFQAAQLRQQRATASLAQLEDLRRKVASATSAQQLQDAIPLRGKFSMVGINWTLPLDELRQEMRTRIAMAQVEANRPAEQVGASSDTGPGRGRRRRRRRGPLRELNETNSAEVRFWTHAQRSLVRVSQLLLWAAAFALMAQRPTSDLPLLVEWTAWLNRPRRRLR
jgi:hypothetical protein